MNCLRHTLFGCLALVCLVLTSQPARSADFATGPIPSWVVSIAVPHEGGKAATEASNGRYDLLVDSQTRVEAEDKTTYRHFATKALSEQGVNDVANISIDFDPSYQKLTIHEINVWRNGGASRRLHKIQVHILQREKDLEHLIYDGSKSAHIMLDDVRVGDIVEYAYSLSGENPVFQHRVAGGATMQWAVPVQLVSTRLLVPLARHFATASYHFDAAPVVSEHDGYRDMRWTVSDMPGIAVEQDAPGWYDPFAEVQWSEYQDWQALVKWALPLYRMQEAPSAELRARIDAIAATTQDPTKRMMAALQLVQGDIRYLGVEVGAGSHAPSSPNLVLKRRFGDCKDKVFLTVTLMRALGIDASPALVNTEETKGIAELLPTPAAFDHVIVAATVKGKRYWLDATHSPQMAEASHVYQPDFGLALVLNEATTELESMNEARASAGTRHLHAVFDAQGAAQAAVGYTVTTVVDGGEAERMRGHLAAQSRAELEKQYLNYYSNFYPMIEMTAPLEVKDEVGPNRVTIIEHYSIHDFWKTQKHGRREVYIHVPDVSHYLKGPDGLHRVAPLRIAYPVNFNQVTEVRLPPGFDIESSDTSVRNPAFEYSDHTKFENDTLTLNDHFQTLADAVEVDAVPRYAADLDRADDSLGETIYWRAPKPAEPTVTTRPDREVGKVVRMVLIFVIVWLGVALGPRYLALVRLSTNVQLGLWMTAVIAPFYAMHLFPTTLGILVLGLPLFVVILFRVLRNIIDKASDAHWIHVLPIASQVHDLLGRIERDEKRQLKPVVLVACMFLGLVLASQIK